MPIQSTLCALWVLVTLVVSSHSQTGVNTSQVFPCNVAAGFSPSTTIWGDLPTDFDSLKPAGTLSESRAPDRAVRLLDCNLTNRPRRSDPTRNSRNAMLTRASLVY